MVKDIDFDLPKLDGKLIEQIRIAAELELNEEDEYCK
jgi:hypothetical protein